MLGNTYHFSFRPGSKVVCEHGGFCKFSKNNSAFLADSGGFQVFSLKNRRISHDGVTFKSHIDDKKFHMTVKRSSEI